MKKLFLKNQNSAERIVRLIISFFLLPAPFIYECDTFSIVQAIIGGVLLFNAISGICVIYQMFGANTCNIN